MSDQRRATEAAIEARFAAARAKLTTLAVTGTNGKTTTVSMIEAVVRASGEPSARLTTLGAVVDDTPIEASNPSEEFLATVEMAVAREVRSLALEVTSKALAAGLARRWPANIAVFTNLSRDHLDMHGSAEHYLASKAQLFMLLSPGGTAVLNGDDENTALIAELIPAHITVQRFSVRDATADLSARDVVVSPRGTSIELAPSPLADALGGRLDLAVVGRVHAENALGAALAAAAAGYSADAIRRGLAAFQTVSGRFEIVGREPLVAVDYAHTPDGLRGTLTTARELVGDGGRLICVFGCGGDRDKGKRPLMGVAVDERADVAILTSDNPRFEEPQAIADDVLEAVRDGARAEWHVELDRPTAIGRAVALAGPADVVVIAGKGHEAEQEIRGQKFPMSDQALARQAIDS